MSMQQLMSKGRQGMSEIDKALERTHRNVEDTKQIGVAVRYCASGIGLGSLDLYVFLANWRHGMSPVFLLWLGYCEAR
jgi:hypothetical protein